jgi:hypothetical protein
MAAGIFRRLAAHFESPIVSSMSTVAEIEAALEKLTPAQQREIADWLESRLLPESPAMLEALDEGIGSLASEPTVPIEEVRGKIKTWTTK